MLTQYSEDMERVIRALNLCRTLHKGQVDKCGQPYWIHAFTVGMRIFNGHNKNTISNMIVGLLHDIPEDNGITIEALATLIELTDEEKLALNLLTRKDGVPYDKYIDSILESGCTLAVEVKLEDLLHNMNMDRFEDAGVEITHKDDQRFYKYSKYATKLIEKLNEG
jgi:hypothetical protein